MGGAQRMQFGRYETCGRCGGCKTQECALGWELQDSRVCIVREVHLVWVYMAWEVQECGEVLLWVGVSPAEINQRVSGGLAGLQSCNCLFFANIGIIIVIIIIINVIVNIVTNTKIMNTTIITIIFIVKL